MPFINRYGKLTFKKKTQKRTTSYPVWKCWIGLTWFMASESTTAPVERVAFGCNISSSSVETTTSFSSGLMSKEERILPLSLSLVLGRALSPMSPASETLSHSSSLSVWWLVWLDMLVERLLIDEPVQLSLSMCNKTRSFSQTHGPLLLDYHQKLHQGIQTLFVLFPIFHRI